MTCQLVYNFDLATYKSFREKGFQIIDFQYNSETVLQTLKKENPCFC